MFQGREALAFRVISRIVCGHRKMMRSKRWGRAGALGLVLMAILLASPLYGEGTGKKRAVVVPGVSLFGPMASEATLTLNPTTVTFPTSTPLTTVTAPMTASLTLTNPSNNTAWTLNIRASGDLTGPDGTIPIGSISWAATCNVLAGSGTCVPVAGQALTTSDVLTASGDQRHGAPGQFQAAVTYTFAFTDSWNYTAGTYSQQATLTVNAP